MIRSRSFFTWPCLASGIVSGPFWVCGVGGMAYLLQVFFEPNDLGGDRRASHLERAQGGSAARAQVGPPPAPLVGLDIRRAGDGERPQGAKVDELAINGVDSTAAVDHEQHYYLPADWRNWARRPRPGRAFAARR